MTNEVDNMKKALDLVRTSGDDLPALKSREVGVSLVLLSFAEAQSQRIANLSTTVLDLEGKVFSEEALKDLDTPQKLIYYYNLATKNLGEASKYLMGVLATVDWEAVKAELFTLTLDGTEDYDIEVVEAADYLLRKLTSTGIRLKRDKVGAETPADLPIDITEAFSEVPKTKVSKRRKVKLTQVSKNGKGKK